MENLQFHADLVSISYEEINEFLATGKIVLIVSDGLAHSTAVSSTPALLNDEEFGNLKSIMKEQKK